MYQQVYDPVGHSLGLSTIFAVLPLVTLFVLLGGLRVKAQWAALASLAVAIVVAIVVYPMPVGQALDAGAEGAAFGLFPIMWIVVNAIWIFNMTEASGHLAVLRRSFARVSDDLRIQAILIAFCFGALIEALAGFGTPVAMSAVMLVALGFRPILAASVALVANTAPVAFGAIAVPITTLASVTALPQDDLGSMVGRQTPLLALIVPLILVAMVDGRRGLRQTWPAALVAGVAFALGQFVTSNHVSVELTDIVASLVSAAAVVGFLQIWHPSGTPAVATRGPRPAGPGGGRPAIAGGATYDPVFEREARRRADDRRDTPGEIVVAYMPYLIIIAVFALAQISWLPFKDFLANRTAEFNWPGLDILNGKGEAPLSQTFKFTWASAAGTLLLLSGLLTMPVLRIGIGRAARIWVNGRRAALGHRHRHRRAGPRLRDEPVGRDHHDRPVAGRRRRGLRLPVGDARLVRRRRDRLGHLVHALFGALQVSAAHKADLSPTLMAAANSSGGVLGKMISPQNLAIGAAAVGLAGREGDLFRRVIGWSLVLMVLMCVIVYLQSTSLLSWMVP
jgi:lactate permease